MYSISNEEDSLPTPELLVPTQQMMESPVFSPMNGDGKSIWQSEDTVEGLLELMEDMRDAIVEINRILTQLRVHCEAEAFFDLIRPWLASWPKEGVLYTTQEGDVTYKLLSGASGKWFRGGL